MNPDTETQNPNENPNGPGNAEPNKRDDDNTTDPARKSDTE